MELPHLGEHCQELLCKQLDFLPVKCDACGKTFCKDHMLYANHNCEAAYKKDVQVPVCPLCNRPVPVNRGEMPDLKVGQHIDTDCQSDPAKQKRKIYTNKCSHRGCKQKEMVNITCCACNKSFCLKHRHPQDHGCAIELANSNRKNHMKPLSRAGAAAFSRSEANQGHRSPQSKHISIDRASMTAERVNGSPQIDNSRIQGNLSEDEALARALQMSLLENNPTSMPGTNQEEEDRRLAEALAASEATARNSQPSRRGQRDLCNVS